MGAAVPALLSLVGTVYAVNQANQRSREAQRLAEQQMQREQELARPTAEQAARYNQLVNQLAYIAGIDPTNMFVTEGLRGGATLDAPEVRQGRFDVIPDDVLDAVISNAQADITEQLRRSQEQVLENLARRGLAGSSLVDERQAFLEREANRSLADIRARAQLEDERLNAQFAQQALQLLAGLDPMQNLQAGTLGFQSLLQQAQDAQKGFEDLIAGLVSFGLDELRQPETWDALSNLWSNITGRGWGAGVGNTATTGGAGTGGDFQLRLGDYSTLFSGR